MTWWRLVGVLLVAGPFLADKPIYAQDNAGAVVADRPGFGDRAAIVLPGRFQVEAGYAFAWTDSTERHSLGQLLLRLGVLPRIELRAALNSFVVYRQDPDSGCLPEAEACYRYGAARVDGLEDVALGAKINLIHSRRIGKPTLTAIAMLGLPTGEAAFSADALRPELRLALDLALSPTIHFSGNGGYVFTFEADGTDDFFTSAALSMTFPSIDGLGAFAGIYSLYPRNFEFIHVFEGGVTYKLQPQLQFDLNLGVGLKGEGPDLTLGIGVARRF